MTDNNGIIPRSPSKNTAIPNMVLNVANDSTLRDGSKRKNVANHKSGLASAVNELAGVHTLGSDEELLLVLVAEGMAEGDAGEGSATAGVVDDIGNDALEVAIALAEVEAAEASRALAMVRVGAENGASTLTLSSDHTPHCCSGGGDGEWRGLGLGFGVSREFIVVA